MDEKRELEMIETAYEEERDRVEEEWKRGRDMIRKRLLEGIEERRRRAREEKDGEGNVGGSYVSSKGLAEGLTSTPTIFRRYLGFAIPATHNKKAQKSARWITPPFTSNNDSQRQPAWSCDSWTPGEPTLTVDRRIAFPVPPPPHINTATLR